MSWLDLLKLWPIALFVTQGLSVWAWWSFKKSTEDQTARQLKTALDPVKATTDALDARLDVHHDRLGAAEGHIRTMTGDIEGLPTKADLAKIEGQVMAVAKEVAATNAGVGRLEGYFLKRGVEGVAG